MKTYCIYDNNGDLKKGWEEINCDRLSVDGDMFGFMDETGKYLIFYKLGQGEALVLSYEED